MSDLEELATVNLKEWLQLISEHKSAVAERDELRDDVTHLNECLGLNGKALLALRAENERLRKALLPFAAMDIPDDYEGEPEAGICVQCGEAFADRGDGDDQYPLCDPCAQAHAAQLLALIPAARAALEEGKL